MPTFTDLRSFGLLKFQLPNNDIIDSLLAKIRNVYDAVSDATSIDPDTLPQNTLDPVYSVVNPLTSGPNAGLPGPINGVRYLIVENVGYPGSSTLAWGNLVAAANDIIEYSSSLGQWFVSFDSNASTTVEYVTNLTTNIQYRYIDGAWMKSVDGWYDQGDYSVVI
jgi:hypothetical protein